MPNGNEKSLPLRKCVGCTQMLPKESLVRVVKNKEGEIFIDRGGKANGRGAYICKCSADCIQAARKGRRIEKTLKAPVPEEIYQELEKAQ